MNDSILSEALPEPFRDGQQIAQAMPPRPPRRTGRGGRELTPVEEMRVANYESHLRAIEKLEPNNRHLTRLAPPDWIPTQRDVDRMHEELIRAHQRAPGAIDTLDSGIGVGRFSKESIPARSTNRDFSESERSQINEIGNKYGCHTCGTRNPGTPLGNWVLDHQPASRLSRRGLDQRLFPHCRTCSVRQGGLVSSQVGREEE